MCGLTVVAGNNHNNDVEKFRQIVVANTIRGRDATGIAAIHTNKVNIYKKPTDAFDLFDRHYKETQSVLSSMARCLLGHNRAATRGGMKEDAAHPFRHGDIVGMHNGHIIEQSLKDLPDQTVFPTDSEHIIKNIAKHGAEATFRYLRGDWSVVWYNIKEHKLYFTTNGKRPLFFALAKNNKNIWLGSEKGLLQWILDRTEHHYTKVELAQPIEPCHVNMLYTVDIGMGSVKMLPVTKLESGKYFFTPSPNYSSVPEFKKPDKPLVIPETSGPTSPVKPKPLLTLVKTGPATVTPPTQKTAGLVEDIPVFTDEELRDLPEVSVRDLMDRVTSTIASLVKKRESALVILADINWSDNVTWRKNTRSTVQNICTATFVRDRNLRILRTQERRLQRQIERRDMIRQADLAFKASQISVSPPPNLELADFKTMADMFTGESYFTDFMKKHSCGCAVCSEKNPLNFTVANSVLLKDDQGFICANCAEKPSVMKEFIIPMAMRA